MDNSESAPLLKDFCDYTMTEVEATLNYFGFVPIIYYILNMFIVEVNKIADIWHLKLSLFPQQKYFDNIAFLPQFLLASFYDICVYDIVFWIL